MSYAAGDASMTRAQACRWAKHHASLVLETALSGGWSPGDSAAGFDGIAEDDDPRWTPGKRHTATLVSRAIHELVEQLGRAATPREEP